MDNATFKKQMVDGIDHLWLSENREEHMQAVSNIHMGGWIPSFIFGPVRLLRSGCATDGKLSKDFITDPLSKKDKKHLRPLIFSHGLGSCKEHY